MVYANDENIFTTKITRSTVYSYGPCPYIPTLPHLSHISLTSRHFYSLLFLLRWCKLLMFVSSSTTNPPSSVSGGVCEGVRREYEGVRCVWRWGMCAWMDEGDHVKVWGVCESVRGSQVWRCEGMRKVVWRTESSAVMCRELYPHAHSHTYS